MRIKVWAVSLLVLLALPFYARATEQEQARVAIAIAMAMPTSTPQEQAPIELASLSRDDVQFTHMASLMLATTTTTANQGTFFDLPAIGIPGATAQSTITPATIVANGVTYNLTPASTTSGPATIVIDGVRYALVYPNTTTLQQPMQRVFANNVVTCSNGSCSVGAYRVVNSGAQYTYTAPVQYTYSLGSDSANTVYDLGLTYGSTYDGTYGGQQGGRQGLFGGRSGRHRLFGGRSDGGRHRLFGGRGSSGGGGCQ